MNTITSTEAKVGLFILAALALLVAFVLSLSDISLRPGFPLNIDFGYCGGLQVGAPVKMSGIRIGRITSLSILDTQASPAPAPSLGGLGQSARPLVRAHIVLDSSSIGDLLQPSTHFAVATQGVIGEAYIEMQPSENVTASQNGAAPLPADTAIRGVDAPRLHVMTLQLSALLDSVGQLLGSGTDAELGAVGQSLSSLLQSINGIVSEKRPELARGLGDMAAAAGELRTILAHLRVALGSEEQLQLMVQNTSGSIQVLAHELPGLLSRVRSILGSAEALGRKADQAVDAEVLAATVHDLRQSAAQMSKLSGTAVTMLSSVQRGEGTVGGLVTDPQIYDDLKEMLRDLKRNPWKVFWRD